ncbi:MAG: HEPN domain-containing protein [Polyangiaceae bacterium]|nr:HEPN domain-containing protein [Polyangiaceae bacterium]
MAIRLDEKAQENLEAARHLLDREAADLCSASASRAYFAAYLAVADLALQRGHRYPDGNYFRHNEFPQLARTWRLLTDDQRDDLALIRDRRVKADYTQDFVDVSEASESLEIAESFVGLLEEVAP